MRLLLFLCLLTAPLSASEIWWEGEDTLSDTFNEQGFYPAPFKDLLRGGSWLYHSGTSPAYAKYIVDVPETGDYHLWARVFWHHGPFRWRFNEEPWEICDDRCGLVDSVYLAPHISANWKYLGKVTLESDRHSFTVELLSQEGEKVHAAFDCFLLTTDLFIPGPTKKKAEEGMWAFTPTIDPFTDDAMLNLRFLNEETAGQSGFMTRDGNKLKLGDGTPVNLWGVNITHEALCQPNELIDYLAKRLAKVGVNAIRCHTDPFKNDRLLDRLHYLVAAMKKEGIYTTLSFYYPLWFDEPPFAQIFFDKEMQTLWRSRAKTILTTLNPYTGKALKDDPALAIIEMVNEDSLFFWTFNDKQIPEEKLKDFETQYAQYLEEKHGSLHKALTSWAWARHRRDDAKNARAALLNAGELSASSYNSANLHKRRRIEEQRAFLKEKQETFYLSAKNYLKNKLGCKSLLVASNWITADPDTLDKLERESYQACDIIDNHTYFNLKTTGNTYAVNPGDEFEIKAPTFHPQLPTTWVEGFPHITSEINWSNPNPYRSSATFVMSTSPLDGIFWFVVNHVGWSANAEKFPLSVPSTLGQFPAHALQYRLYQPQLKSKEEIAIIDTPHAQGVTGFLKDVGSIRLTDATLTSLNDFGTISLVSLDGKPLATSKKILVQAFTQEKPYGFKIHEGTITSLGEPPMNVQNIEATISLKGEKPSRVVSLDPHGYPVKELPAEATIKLPKDALYTIIERSAL